MHMHATVGSEACVNCDRALPQHTHSTRSPEGPLRCLPQLSKVVTRLASNLRSSAKLYSDHAAGVRLVAFDCG